VPSKLADGIGVELTVAEAAGCTASTAEMAATTAAARRDLTLSFPRCTKRPVWVPAMVERYFYPNREVPTSAAHQ